MSNHINLQVSRVDNVPENLFCDGQKLVTACYRDNWYRIFAGVPEFSEPVLEMLYEFAKKGQYGKAMIFFAGECGFENDYSEFLLRELINGNL